MQDEIIRVNNTEYSLRRILEEDGWQLYCKASDKVKNITRLRIRMDLSAMEMGFARLNKLFKQKEVKAGCNADSHDDGIPPNNKLLGILPTIV